jgi:hypothetical protein
MTEKFKRPIRRRLCEREAEFPQPTSPAKTGQEQMKSEEIALMGLFGFEHPDTQHHHQEVAWMMSNREARLHGFIRTLEG